MAFFHGGGEYDKAWANGFPPDGKKNNSGHLWSGIGAGFVAGGLWGLARSAVASTAAITGGVLHVGGKVGSLLDPKHDAFYKTLPLASRVPAVVSLVEDIRKNIIQQPHFLDAGMHSLLPLGLIGANIIWARADAMLMPDGRAKHMLGRVLRIAPTNG